MHKTSPILKIAKWLLLLLVLVPFIVDEGVFFPFIEGKAFALRLIATVSLILLAGFLIFGKAFQKQEFVLSRARLLKNPISILMGLFLISALVSTILAKDSYRSFTGTVERGEGFMGLLFFILIFYLVLLIFDSQDWKLFFRGVSATGIIFSIHQIIQLARASWDFGLRPFSTFGNPSLLAGYYLFVLFVNLALLADVWPKLDLTKEKNITPPTKKRNLTFLFLPFSSIIFSIIGIFLTQTRGTYLGFAVGILVVSLYFSWKFILEPVLERKKKKTLKTLIPILSVLLVLIFIIGAFGILVYFSNKAETAQNEASFGFFDALTRRLGAMGAIQTRLISAGSSLASVNPKNEGINRLLFGWGLDNFNVAYNTYFNPRYFLYEEVWFDRAHNKVLDVLVMQGLFGLVLFLGIWGTALVYGLNLAKNKIAPDELDIKDKTSPSFFRNKILISGAILFFVISYFVHDLFLFESPATGIALSVFFAFVVQLKESQRDFSFQLSPAKLLRMSVFWSVTAGVLAVIILILFFKFTLVPYLQMRYYINLIQTGLTPKELAAKIDKAFYPYTYAQENIRMEFLKTLPKLPPEEGIAELAKKSFEAMDDLIEKQPYEPRYPMNMGQILDDLGLREKAEIYYRRALSLTPNRPDLLYLLAQNLVVQGKIKEAEQGPLAKLFELSKEVPKAGVLYGVALIYAPEEYKVKTFDVLQKALNTPGIMSRLGTSLPVVRLIYEDFMAKFVKARDKENFLAALDTAIRVEEYWELLQEQLYRQGKITELPWKDESEKKSKIYKEIKEKFPQYGWAIVSVKEK